MENKTYQISKLNGANFFLWRIKIEMLLQKEKVWGVIEEEAPDPITPDWRMRDQSARATIGLSIQDHILVTTANCRTAKQMWDLLTTTYQHKGLASRLYLLKKLFSSNYDQYGNMESYLNAIQENIERLRAIGEEVKEYHVVAVILGGLPQQFNPLITALENKEGDELKVSYVLEKLRDDATRLETTATAYKEGNTALYTHPMNRRPIICHLCNKSGHVRRNCPQMRTKESKEDEDRYGSYCTIEEEGITPSEKYTEWAMNISTPEPSQKQHWMIDSGASCHMTCHKTILNNYIELTVPIKVKVADGRILTAVGEGSTNVSTLYDNHNTQIKLTKVLYIPTIEFQLISVPLLCLDGYTVHFYSNHCEINLKTKTMAIAKRQDKSYILIPSKSVNDTMEMTSVCVHVWHNRLGHRSLPSIKRMSKDKQVQDLNINECKHSDFCKYCQIGAMRQTSFKKSKNHATARFKTLVSDLCGPISPCSLGGNLYMITITDEFTNYTHVGLIKNKYDAGTHIRNFIQKGRTKFGYYPEIFRSDEGGEFMSSSLKEFFDSNGITHQTSVVYTPQQNGRAERKNLALFNMARSMLKASSLPKTLWGEAVTTAGYLLNRMVHSEQSITPYEMWNGVRPSVNHIRTFGCPAYAHISRKLRRKLDDTSREGYLVGYGFDKKSFRIWIPGTNQIVNGISVKFNETFNPRAININGSSSSESQHVIDIYDEPTSTDDLPVTPPLRKSQRCNFGVPAAKLTY